LTCKNVPHKFFVFEIEGGTIGHHVVQDVTHGIAVFPGWQAIKVKRQQILLADLTVTITV
jgi:hypothetical protein